MIDSRKVFGAMMIFAPVAYVGMKAVQKFRSDRNVVIAMREGSAPRYLKDEKEYAIQSMNGVEFGVYSGVLKGSGGKVFFTKTRCVGDKSWAYDVGVNGKLKHYTTEKAAMERAVYRARKHPCFKRPSRPSAIGPSKVSA